MDKKVKPKAAAIELDREQRKVTLTVQDLRRSRNVRTHLVLTTYPERSGSVVAQKA